LIAFSLACGADTNLTPHQVIDMIERYESLYDECMVRYSTEPYTYESYLLGDEKKLEPLPKRFDVTKIYSSKGSYHRMDTTVHLGEYNEYRTEVSDGERNVQWNTSDFNSAGQATLRPANEETDAIFPVQALRPFHFSFTREGVKVENLEVEKRGSDVVLRWPRAPDYHFEMCCERWGGYLRPRWTRSIVLPENEPDYLAHERKYYYRDGVDESGKESMQLIKWIDLVPVHDICSFKLIEEIDFSPQFDSSVFEFELQETTRVRDKTGGFIGKEAPELSAAAWVNVEPVTLASLRGNPIVLVFWDSADESSAELIKILNSLAAERRDLAVIAVHSADADQSGLQELAKKEHTAFRIVIDEEVWGTWPGATFRKYRIKRPPAVFIIDAEGKVRFQDIPLEAAAEALKSLLDEQ
jgi:peroxiredoxin